VLSVLVLLLAKQLSEVIAKNKKIKFFISMTKQKTGYPKVARCITGAYLASDAMIASALFEGAFAYRAFEPKRIW